MSEPKKKRWRCSITGSGAMALRKERMIEQDFTSGSPRHFYRLKNEGPSGEDKEMDSKTTHKNGLQNIHK